MKAVPLRSHYGPSTGPSVAEMLASHAVGTGSPVKTAARVADAIASRGDDGTWLSTVPRDELLAAAENIERRPGATTLPLYGVPFALATDTAGSGRVHRQRGPRRGRDDGS